MILGKASKGLRPFSNLFSALFVPGVWPPVTVPKADENPLSLPLMARRYALSFPLLYLGLGSTRAFQPTAWEPGSVGDVSNGSWSAILPYFCRRPNKAKPFRSYLYFNLYVLTLFVPLLC